MDEQRQRQAAGLPSVLVSASDIRREFGFAGLPLTGALPRHSNVFAAFGYGGNGITFSAMAAHLIAEAMFNTKNPLLDCFRIDRG